MADTKVMEILAVIYGDEKPRSFYPVGNYKKARGIVNTWGITRTKQRAKEIASEVDGVGKRLSALYDEYMPRQYRSRAVPDKVESRTYGVKKVMTTLFLGRTSKSKSDYNKIAHCIRKIGKDKCVQVAEWCAAKYANGNDANRFFSFLSVCEKHMNQTNQ